jgi:hypothetical protein
MCPTDLDAQTRVNNTLVLSLALPTAPSDAVVVSRNLACEYLCDNTRSGGATSSNMALQLIPCLVADNGLLETEFTRVQINDRLTRLEIEFTELFPLILQALRMTLD